MLHKARTAGAVRALEALPSWRSGMPCLGHAHRIVHGRALRPCLVEALAWPLLASCGPLGYQAHDDVYLLGCGAPTLVSPRGRRAPPFVCPSGFVVPSLPGLLIRGARVAVLQLGIENRETEWTHERLACLSGCLTSYLTTNGLVDRRVGRGRTWAAMIFQHEAETRSLKTYYVM